MALEIRKSSKWWYAAFTINGQKTVINLGVQITGKRPPKRTMLGDDEFERSRGRAQEAHDRQEKQLTLDRNAESALRKLVEIKTGKPAGFPKLAELPKSISRSFHCCRKSWNARELPGSHQRTVSLRRRKCICGTRMG